MKRKIMLLTTVKLLVAILLTAIATGLFITGADTESFQKFTFIFDAFVIADLISEITIKLKKRKR
ncbi:hypothetical protein [uncultured Treponema sp.]|uniref:hypothetical protein n=1 Tax=uncultured Treponema sp. TaxID=162155 RepID=UPI0025EB5070|nr:hypothetical protein [uncultured Treponema sp.]